jgi:hypothetical protein
MKEADEVFGEEELLCAGNVVGESDAFDCGGAFGAGEVGVIGNEAPGRKWKIQILFSTPPEAYRM